MLEFFRFKFFGKRPKKEAGMPSVETHTSKNREYVWYLSAAFTQNRINKGTMLFQHSSKTSSQKVVSNFLMVCSEGRCQLTKLRSYLIKQRTIVQNRTKMKVGLVLNAGTFLSINPFAILAN